MDGNQRNIIDMYSPSAYKIDNLKNCKNKITNLFRNLCIFIFLSEKIIIFFSLLFRYLVLISGLEIGSNEEQIFSLQLFVDMVTGMLGNGEEQSHCAEICRVIVAGNSLSSSTQDKDSLQKVQT